jgi:DNA-binding transcriptional regulator YhcF (GntR family)
MGVSDVARFDVARFDKDALSSQLPLPLYLQLARYVRNLILGGKLGHRDALPSERELAERFAVSRVTVRKALRELSEEGLLEQIQGAGTFVNRAPHVEQRLSTLTSFSEDMASRGLVAGSRAAQDDLGRDPEARGSFSPSATVSRSRLRTANGHRWRSSCAIPTRSPRSARHRGSPPPPCAAAAIRLRACGSPRSGFPRQARSRGRRGHRALRRRRTMLGRHATQFGRARSTAMPTASSSSSALPAAVQDGPR